MLTQAELKELLHYDPLTGEFRWKVSRGRYAKVGSLAGKKVIDEYISIKIDGKMYKAHRLAWLYMTGEWPSDTIDHRNGKKHENKWSNLRKSTSLEQGQNKKKYENNTTGFTGVVNHKPGKWRAAISYNRKRIHLGVFDTPQEAHEAYLDAKTKYHTFNPIPR